MVFVDHLLKTERTQKFKETGDDWRLSTKIN